MDFLTNINKIAYNSFQHEPMQESIEVNLTVKFGIADENNLARGYFFDVDITAKNKETDTVSRTLLLEITFQYELEAALENKLGNIEIETTKDVEYYERILKSLDNIVKTITSQDGRRPFQLKDAGVRSN